MISETLDLTGAIQAAVRLIEHQQYRREAVVFDGRTRLRIANNACEMLDALVPEVIKALRQHANEIGSAGMESDIPFEDRYLALQAEDWLKDVECGKTARLAEKTGE